MVTFEEQRFLNLMKSSSSISSFVDCAWAVPFSLSLWFTLSLGAPIFTLTTSLDPAFIPV